jgi:tellurite methyltransferase
VCGVGYGDGWEFGWGIDREFVITMRETLAGNISRYRKALSLTQEELAKKLNISFQAVSKWETTQTVPDTLLLPAIAQALEISVDKLLGYAAFKEEETYYETAYRGEGYYWGLAPNRACFKVLELHPPVRRLSLFGYWLRRGQRCRVFRPLWV